MYNPDRKIIINWANLSYLCLSSGSEVQEIKDGRIFPECNMTYERRDGLSNHAYPLRDRVRRVILI